MDIAKSKRCRFTSVRLSSITRNQLNACFLLTTKSFVSSLLSEVNRAHRCSTEAGAIPTVNTVITVYTVSLYTVFLGRTVRLDNIVGLQPAGCRADDEVCDVW